MNWTARRDRFGRASHHQWAFLFLLLYFDLWETFFIFFVRVVGAVPEIVAVVLVGRPATVLFVILVIRGAAATATTIAEIVRVIVTFGKPECFVQLFTARHVPPPLEIGLT